jgi:hypothetical protein
MIVNFLSEDGDVLTLPAKSFLSAYLKACELDFPVYDFDIEEEDL